MKLLLIALALTSATSSFAASTRLITCKGLSATSAFPTFRINILRDETRQVLKANLSAGFTTMNTLHTWQVDLMKEGSQLVIRNLNKTPFEMKLNLSKHHAVDNIKGKRATIKTEFMVKPAYAEPREFSLQDGILACEISKKLTIE